MLKGDPNKDGFEHEYLWWCPECGNIEEVELLNPLCQICGTEFVDIDKRMFPIIHTLSKKQHTIKTLACCEGHFKESKPDVYEWNIPYIKFSVNPDAKISDIFNGKFPMLSVVKVVPDVTCIDEDDIDKFLYKFLSKQFDNYQFEMNWCIYMDEGDIPTVKDNDPDSYYTSEELWKDRQKAFLQQLLEWAKSLK